MQYYTTVVKDVLAVLKVNQSIEISFDHADFLDDYVTRIEALEADTMGVSMPTKRRVPPGTHCWVYLIRERQRYGFESVIQGYVKDNILLMILSCPAEILRLQRRKFFRVPVALPASCTVLSADTGPMDLTVVGVIVNISSGGVLLSAEAPLEAGREVRLSFNLSPETALREIAGRVVRATESTGGGLPEYGIEFTELSHSLRDLIMRYVFSREIELKQVKDD